jgi:hypothetical protein
VGERKRPGRGGSLAGRGSSGITGLGDGQWSGFLPQKDGSTAFPENPTIRVGLNDVSFNTAVTRWLGVWLDSQLTLTEHHAIRLKEGKKALGRLHRLTAQMGLAPVNCRKVMTACIQSVAMLGSELWWKGDGVEGWYAVRASPSSCSRIVTSQDSISLHAISRRHHTPVDPPRNCGPHNCPLGRPSLCQLPSSPSHHAAVQDCAANDPSQPGRTL